MFIAGHVDDSLLDAVRPISGNEEEGVSPARVAASSLTQTRARSHYLLP